MAIMVGGFPPTDPEAQALLPAQPLGIASLHVIGSSDPFVSTEKAEALCALFEGGKMLRHTGGHIVPPNNLKQQLRDFAAEVSAAQ